LTKNINKYKHLFFDLDHTLWDFERNSRAVIKKLFAAHKLKDKLGIKDAEFIQTYERINHKLWSLYRNGRITKESLRKKRFSATLATFGMQDDILAANFDRDYLQLAPYQKNLMAGCLPMLENLEPNFELHIITNGFSEIQAIKLRESGLAPFFKLLITSDQIKVHKPQAKIFVEALRLAGANRSNSLMIGDNLLADVQGARNAGIDQVFYNPLNVQHTQRTTFEINHLNQLPGLLL
jgi:putative hydrolase of the HAD superfamily